MVLAAHQALSSVDLALIRMIANVKSREVIIVVNRIDELPDPVSQVPEIRNSIVKTLTEFDGPKDAVHAALRAIERVQNVDVERASDVARHAGQLAGRVGDPYVEVGPLVCDHATEAPNRRLAWPQRSQRAGRHAASGHDPEAGDGRLSRDRGAYLAAPPWA